MYVAFERLYTGMNTAYICHLCYDYFVQVDAEKKPLLRLTVYAAVAFIMQLRYAVQPNLLLY